MDWKKIPGFADYEISTNGDVVSTKVGIRKPVKPSLSMSGYLVVKLAGSEGYHTRHVHRLLAECFIEGGLEGLVVNHRDGNKLNNQLTNLEWVTHRSNDNHAIKHLEKQPYYPKLEYDDAVAMRNDRARGMTYQQLMDKYKVGQGVVYGVLSNRNYKEEGLFQRRNRSPLPK